jgi:hypothetical protein
MTRGGIAAMLLALAATAGLAFALLRDAGPGAGIGPPAPRPGPPPRVLAFVSDLGGAELRRLRQVGDRLDVVAPNWHGVSLSSGAFSGPGRDPALLRVARGHGVRVWPVVNAIGGGRFLTDPAARGRLVEQLTRLPRAHGYAGVTLDFEEFPVAERDDFTALVAEVGAELHARGQRLAVYVPRGSDAYDEAALARLADLVLASGYNEHWAGGPAGPVATLDGFAAVSRRAVGIAGEKAAPVLGAFGYRWPAGGGTATMISSVEAEALRARIGGAPGAFAADGDAVHYATAADLRAQLRAAREARAHWVALFSLGREPAGFWRAEDPASEQA